jgi:hypothetical protein
VVQRVLLGGNHEARGLERFRDGPAVVHVVGGLVAVPAIAESKRERMRGAQVGGSAKRE